MEIATAASGRSVLERALAEMGGADTDDDDATRTRLLDAAYQTFCDKGIQRASMDEVARTAQLSRITVYRKFKTKDDLVDEVVRREFRHYFGQFVLDIASARSAAERVEVGFVSALRSIGGNPLIGGLIKTEAELIIGSLIGEDGHVMATVAEFVAGQLRREQRAGHISEDVDADLVAEMMVRISASFLTVPSKVVDIEDDTQLRSIARTFLVPMLEPPVGSAS